MARRRRRLQKGRETISIDPLQDFEGPPFLLFFARLFYFLRLHLRALLIVAILIILSLALTIAYLAWQELRERESLLAFEKLLEEPVMQPDSGAEEVALEKLKEYQQNFSDKKAQLRANIYILDNLQKLEKKEEALLQALSLAEKMETPELRYHYYLRAGFLAEELKNYREANEAYQKAVQALSAQNYLKAIALLSRARVLIQLDMREEARQELNKALAIQEEGADRLHPHIAAYLLQLGKQ